MRKIVFTLSVIILIIMGTVSVSANDDVSRFKDRANGIEMELTDSALLVKKGSKSWTVDYPGVLMGYSEEAGYIFRKEDEVYAINVLRKDNDSYTCTACCIATGVKLVVSTSYQFSTDRYETVLLQMEDGSLIAYVGNGVEKNEADLRPIVYEGSPWLKNLILCSDE